MNQEFKPKITLFYCINACSEHSLNGSGFSNDFEPYCIPIPCSGMTGGVFLLRAFESGADAVSVLVCPEGQCRHMEGNTRAGKRVEHVKKILDEIGLDGRRLSIFNISPGDADAVNRVIGEIMRTVKALGPNPAA